MCSLAFGVVVSVIPLPEQTWRTPALKLQVGGTCSYPAKRYTDYLLDDNISLSFYRMEMTCTIFWQLKAMLGESGRAR